MAIVFQTSSVTVEPIDLRSACNGKPKGRVLFAVIIYAISLHLFGLMFVIFLACKCCQTRDTVFIAKYAVCISQPFWLRSWKASTQNAMHEFLSKSLSPSQAGTTVSSLFMED